MTPTLNVLVNYLGETSKVQTLNGAPTVGELLEGESEDHGGWVVAKVEPRNEEIEGVPISYEVWVETDPDYDPDVDPGDSDL